MRRCDRVAYACVPCIVVGIYNQHGETVAVALHRDAWEIIDEDIDAECGRKLGKRPDLRRVMAKDLCVSTKVHDSTQRHAQQ